METIDQLSKRQRRENEQTAWKKQAQRNNQKDLARRVGIWSAVIVGLGLMVWGLAQLGSTPATTDTGAPLSDAVSNADWNRGSLNAPVALVEYSDFQCPACGAAEPTVQSLSRDFGDKLRLVYRNFPLFNLHPNAQLAAQVANAAGLQNKFWEMHDLLFANQKNWAPQADPTAIFQQYATQLNLDTNKFLTDLNSDVVKNRIMTDIASGNRSGVNATPTFFLNGKKVTLQSFSDLHDLVSAAIK